ncbi:MAG TPA: MarR family winged helix-turn-helix transcriptional regulator [Solirubrobacteraceae bacterium]
MALEITFTPQVLGETEKALNAILYRELGHVELTEHQWIVLRLTVIGGGEVGREQLVGRLAGALKVEAPAAEARVDELVAAGLLQASPDAERVAVTEAGGRVHGRVRGAVDEITTRLWGDLPEDDLATTGRTLTTILERANAQFGTA